MTNLSVRATASLTHSLGVEIVQGRRPPGTRLADEVAASEAMNVSRSAYREALRFLTAKGLLESRPKFGTRIAERTRWNLLDPDVLDWIFEGEPETEFALNLLELRLLTEPTIAELAASRHSSDDLARLSIAVARMRSEQLDSPYGMEAELMFQQGLIAAAHNEALTSVCRAFGQVTRWALSRRRRTVTELYRLIGLYETTFSAISAGDSRAAAWATENLIRETCHDVSIFQNVKI